MRPNTLAFLLIFVSPIACQLCPVIIDMAFIVDSSGTLKPLEFRAVKNALIELLGELNVRNQEAFIGLYTFI